MPQDLKSTAARHAAELVKTLDASYLRQTQGSEAPEFKQVGAGAGAGGWQTVRGGVRMASVTWVLAAAAAGWAVQASGATIGFACAPVTHTAAVCYL